MYLDRFRFPTQDQEHNFFLGIKRTCYDAFYPFQVLGDAELQHMTFEPLTILYGGNGSGKTTVLNVIAEKLGLKRDTLFNKTNFYEDYLKLCDYDGRTEMPVVSRMITSDDVFDYMLNVRALNQGIHEKREEVFSEFLQAKYADFHFRTMEDYERLKQVNRSRQVTQSKYTRENLMDNVRTLSNGESGFKYFTEKIDQPGLYLLDEPENSLSPQRQLELMTFLEASIRFYGCQFIIATHSPFLLSMKGGLVYDLDQRPTKVKPWTDLENVRCMYDFFKDHEAAFEKENEVTAT